MSDRTSVGGLPTTPVRAKYDKQVPTTLQARICVNKERTVTTQITKPKDQGGASRAQVSVTFCHKVMKALAELKAEVAKVKRDVRTLKEMGLMTQKQFQFCNRVGETSVKGTVPPTVSGVRKETWSEKDLEEKTWRGTPLRRDPRHGCDENRTHLHTPSPQSFSTQGQAIPTVVRPRSPSPTLSDISSPERNYCSLDVVKILPKEEDRKLWMTWRDTSETEIYCDELISNLMNGPMVRANDVQALQVFADEIWACIHRLEATGMLEAVETKCFLLKVTKRLCGGLQQEYDDRAKQFEKSIGSYPGIRWLGHFVLEVLGRVSIPISREKTEVSVPERFQNQASPQKSELLSPTRQELCPICPGDHTLNACDKFRLMCIQDRIQVVKTLNYCFLCLKGKHIASSCSMRMKCGVNQCLGRHSKLLHLPRDQKGTLVANIEDNQRSYRSTQSESRLFDGNRNTPISVKREPSPEKREEIQESYRDSKRARSWEFQEERETRQAYHDLGSRGVRTMPMASLGGHDRSRTDLSKMTG